LARREEMGGEDGRDGRRREEVRKEERKRREVNREEAWRGDQGGEEMR